MKMDNSQAPVFNKLEAALPKIGRDSFWAYLFLSFVSSAGIFYISALPSIVSSLVDGLGFSEQQAGYAVSANGYGSMLGALFAVFIIGRFYWKRVVSILFVVMIAMELSTVLISSPEVMMAWRFLAGILGGCSIGFGFSILSRLKSPDKGFGFLLVLQVGLGGAIIYLRPLAQELLGPSGVFIMLALLMVISLLCLPFLSSYAKNNEKNEHKPTNLFPRISLMTGLTMLAIFLYQATANGMWAYMERIGLHEGLSLSYVTGAAAVGAWIGAAGGLVPIFLGVRFGRFNLLVSATILSIASAYTLSNAADPNMFFAGNVLVSFSWSYMIAYLLGLAAHYDTNGQLTALGGTASKLGLASGPLIAANLINGTDFSTVLMAAGAGFTLCIIAVAMPARSSDKAMREASVGE